VNLNCKFTDGPSVTDSFQVGESSFNSFPEEVSKKDEAVELVAKKACEDLRKRIELMQGTKSRSTTSHLQEALERVAEVSEKSASLFRSVLREGKR